jgi:peptidase T-like protein
VSIEPLCGNKVTLLISRERIIETLFELVRVDSETGEEGAIAALLKEKFTSLGVIVQEDNAKEETGHGANNLIGTLPGKTDGTAIFFGAHMDTVRPGKNIRPSIRNGYIVSDGRTILGADDKAGLAALIEAFTVLIDDKLPHSELQVIVTVGEESGLLGAKALDTKLLRGKYGFEMDSEGPVGDMTIAAPYQVRFEVDLFGKSAHAGVAPEKGVSAITMAAKAITRMPLGRIDRETTANIGRFEGKGATNVICDHVGILAEARSLIRSKLDRQVRLMTQAFEQTAAEMGGKAEVKTTFMYPGYRFEPDAPIVRLAKAAVQSVGRHPRLLSSGGGSDANVINGKGLPVINMGVGYEQIHTIEERLPVSELVKTSELILALIQQAAHC